MGLQQAINKRQIDNRRTEEEVVSGWCTVRSVRTFVVHKQYVPRLTDWRDVRHQRKMVEAMCMRHRTGNKSRC